MVRYSEDSGHKDGDVGSLFFAVRKDSPSTDSAPVGAEMDYVPLLVDDSGKLWVNAGTIALPSGASTAAKQDTLIASNAAIKTAVELIDNAIDGTEMQVDIVNSPTVSLHSTDRTHLSEIEGAVETIEGAVSGSEMQVDVVASLPAGTNAIGKLAAGTASIGHTTPVPVTPVHGTATGASRSTGDTVSIIPNGDVGSGKRLYITSLTFVCQGAANTKVKLQDTAGNDIHEAYYTATTTAAAPTYTFSFPTPIKVAADNTGVQVEFTFASGSVSQGGASASGFVI